MDKVPGPPLPPKLSNQYTSHQFLIESLYRRVPQNVLSFFERDLERFGGLVVNDRFDELSREAETCPPRLERWDGWGVERNRLVTSSAWKELHRISAVEGIVSIAYDPTIREKLGKYTRIYQMIKLFLFHPSSGMYSCPLAMTDGAACLLSEIAKDIPKSSDQYQIICKTLSHLTSNDPKTFWTSGQWMTELNGGSDVSASTETTATHITASTYKLNGIKWFTSATDSKTALVLAKIDTDPSKKPSLFLVHTKHKYPFNGITIRRLKQKMGTKQLPTAELDLKDCTATLLSVKGKGIPSIAPLLNVTRVYNSVCAVSSMRRMIVLAEEYAKHRVAFGKSLEEHPLHAKTLFEMSAIENACLLFVLEVAVLQGQVETERTESSHLLLRLFTPLCKLFTAKQAVVVLSEGMECFGGQGYIEDTGIPRILRDGHVLHIWEGTTNILALDVLRCLKKYETPLVTELTRYLNNLLEMSELHCYSLLKKYTNCLMEDLKYCTLHLNETFDEFARELSMKICALICAALLYSHYISTRDQTTLDKLTYWIQLHDLDRITRTFPKAKISLSQL